MWVAISRLFQTFFSLPLSTSVVFLIKPQTTVLSDLLISPTSWFHFGVSCCMHGDVDSGKVLPYILVIKSSCQITQHVCAIRGKRVASYFNIYTQ